MPTPFLFISITTIFQLHSTKFHVSCFMNHCKSSVTHFSSLLFIAMVDVSTVSGSGFEEKHQIDILRGNMNTMSPPGWCKN